TLLAEASGCAQFRARRPGNCSKLTIVITATAMRTANTTNANASKTPNVGSKSISLFGDTVRSGRQPELTPSWASGGSLWSREPHESTCAETLHVRAVSLFPPQDDANQPKTHSLAAPGLVS